MRQIFSYRSHVGTFSIRPNNDGKWNLWIEDENLGSYLSPEAAADDVYTQHSGHDDWDDLDEVFEPCDLSEWARR